MIPPQALLSQSNNSVLRKRRQFPSSLQPLETVLEYPSSKKRKLHHPAFPPQKFWENLSETPLTRNTIRAFNEQNSRIPDVLADTRTLRKRPRSIVTGGHQPADQIVGAYSPTSLKRVKAFARHGGPNLTDLRGVCKQELSKNQNTDA